MSIVAALRRLEGHADQQAQGTDLADGGEARRPIRHVPRCGFGQALGMGDDLVALVDLQGFQGGGAAGGGAGEGAAAACPWGVAENLVPARHPGAGLDAAGEILADHQDVRHQIVVLHRPHSARTAEASEHFVGDQQPVPLIADSAQSGHEPSAWYPIAALRQAWLDKDGGDVVGGHDVFGNVGVDVPQAVVVVLRLGHVRRDVLGIGEGGLDSASRPSLHVEVVVAAIGADHLGAQRLAVETGREADDVAPLLVAER